MTDSISEPLAQLLAQPVLIPWTVCWILFGVFLGGLVTWQVYIRKNRDEVLIAHKPKSSRNWGRAVFTFIPLTVFLISIAVGWFNPNYQVPLALQLIVMAAAGTTLGVNLVEPGTRLVLRLIAKEENDTTTKQSKNS